MLNASAAHKNNTRQFDKSMENIVKILISYNIHDFVNKTDRKNNITDNNKCKKLKAEILQDVDCCKVLLNSELSSQSKQANIQATSNNNCFPVYVESNKLIAKSVNEKIGLRNI